MESSVEQLRSYACKYNYGHIVDAGFCRWECTPLTKARAIRIIQKAIRLGLSVEYSNKKNLLIISL